MKALKCRTLAKVFVVMCLRNNRFVLYADRNVLKCRRGKYIMGVAMTVRAKWQFCILFNVRIL